MSYVNKSFAEKGCHGSGDWKASLHRRPGTKGLPDHQDLKESLCQCLGGRDQDGHSHEGRRNGTDPYLKDVPKRRFASAGQTYPEFSPYDRMILDQHLRFIGDAVAIVAGRNRSCRRPCHEAH